MTRCPAKSEVVTGNPEIVGEIQCTLTMDHEGPHQATYPAMGTTTSVEWAEPWG